MDSFRHLFAPAAIGHLSIKNRIVMASMVTGYASLDGDVTERHLHYYRQRAAGGVGLIIVEASVVDNPVGRDGYGQIFIDHPKYISGLQRLTDVIKSYNCRAFIQLFHAGRQTLSKYTEGITPVAPSPIPCRIMKETPRELSSAEISQIIEKFVRSAEYAYRAEFDGVELHAAHGYLLNQFLSAATNRRTDEYGGPLENRTRMLIEICKEIKSRIPQLALSVRLNVDDFIQGGIKVSEAETIAVMLEECGVDIINCSAGIYESGLNSIEPASYEDGWRIYLAEAIKKKVKIPVMAGGMVRKPAMAEQIIADNKADFVFIGRSLLADSEWANKARLGKTEEIRPCIVCNNCISSHFKGHGINCSVNAVTGREALFNKSPSENFKDYHVVVVGGGPSGMQAATALRRFGIKVTLYEKSASLGGMLNWALIPPHKERIGELRDSFINELYKSGTRIITGQRFTAEEIGQNRPDFIIVATGSKARKPDIDGWDDEYCFLPDEIFKKPERIKDSRILVIGGGNTGCELADFLIQYNNQAIIVEENKTIAQNLERKNRRVLLERLHSGQVLLMTDSRVQKIQPGQVEVIREETKKLIEADYIIAAVGFEPDDELSKQLPLEIKPAVFTIGDAFQPSGIKEAVLQGEMIASSIIAQIRLNHQQERQQYSW
jgi:2,4-dienoyl-CoA reductase-like NADH-dependent reductase (Old Yellow Enzyme family)/thioredoxin reductase